MEWLPEAMTDLLEDPNRLPTNFERHPAGMLLVLRLAKQLIAAMRFLHKQRIVHRDLKPGNVLLTPASPARLPPAHGMRALVCTAL